MIATAVILLVVAISAVNSEKVEDKNVGFSIPLNIDINGKVDAKVHASQVAEQNGIFPPKMSKSIGAGLEVKLDNGAIGAVDATHRLGAGTKLDLGAQVPILSSDKHRLDANVHGSSVVGGPYNGAQSVGGGLQYSNNIGVFGGVDATHHQSTGNRFSADVGRSFPVGPGTLSVGVGVAKNSWTPGLEKNIGITYGARW